MPDLRPGTLDAHVRTFVSVGPPRAPTIGDTVTTTTATEAPEARAADTPVRVTRRRIDRLLVGTGLAITVVLVIAGALLAWGNNFAQDYVHDELAAQSITFPTADELEEEGRGDLVEHAEELVDTGTEAEAYADYIGGHVEAIAEGQTSAELGGPQFAAETALNEAIADDAPEAEVAQLQEEYDAIVGQRDTMFRGEMLRGALLNTFAWDTVGQIAGYAAITAFAGATVMALLVLAGALHLRRMGRQTT